MIILSLIGRYASVLLNIEVLFRDGSKCICEIQLYIDGFLTLKKMQHKTYELVRWILMETYLVI